MNWKNWPYWIKGGIVGLCIVICGAIIISAFTAGSSLCGLNSGHEESHTCSIVERTDFFLKGLHFLLIAPFINTAHVFFEYHSWKMLTQTADLFHVFLIIIGIIGVSAFIGYLSGKFKTRHKPNVNGNIS